jgi:thymidine phosphorylase
MAQELADSIVQVARLAGVPTVAVLTDMDQPLAPCAGNALEVFEAIDYLTGARCDPKLHEVVVTLGSELLVVAELLDDTAMARQALDRVLADGSAAERFDAMVSALGGPADLVDKAAEYLPVAPVTRAATAVEGGVITGIDTRALGLAVVELGGGRIRPDDSINPSVGLTELIRVGDEVAAGAILGRVHAQDDADAERAVSAMLDAVKVGPELVEWSPLVREIRRGA